MHSETFAEMQIVAIAIHTVIVLGSLVEHGCSLAVLWANYVSKENITLAPVLQRLNKG